MNDKHRGSDRVDVRDLYYDLIQSKTLLAVDAEHAVPNNPTRASFSHINFYTQGYRFALTTNIDTDEIVIAVEPSQSAPATEPSLHPVLRELVGREFGWIWYATNVQGYNDMLMLAFGATGEGARPQLGFLVEASTINIYRLARC
jgi:hypothetical protein